MANDILCDWENGTSGGNQTTGNTGAQAISTAANSSAVFSSASAYRGSLGGRFQASSTTNGASYAQFMAATSSRYASYRVYFRVETALSGNNSDQRIFRGRNASNGQIFLARISGTGNTTLGLLDAASTFQGAIYSSLAGNVWYRLEVVVDTGTTTSNGSYQAALYEGESTTPVGTLSAFGTANMGGVAAQGCQVGRYNTNTTWTVSMDALRVDIGSPAFIGPVDSIAASGDLSVGAEGTATITGSPRFNAGDYGWAAFTDTAFTSTPRPAGNQANSGTGSATFAGSAATSGSVGTSGTGTFAASNGVPRPASALTAGAAGTQTRSGSPRTSDAWLAAAVGVLTGQGVPDVQAPSNNTAEGTFGGTGTPRVAGTLNLSATGTAASAGTPRPTGTASWAGAGGLNQAPTPRPAGSASWWTEGTGSFTGNGEAPPTYGAGDLLLGAAGTFGSSNAVPHFTRSLGLSGGGAAGMTGTLRVPGSLIRDAATATGLSSGYRIGGDLSLAAEGGLTFEAVVSVSDLLALEASGDLTLYGNDEAPVEDHEYVVAIGERRYVVELHSERARALLFDPGNYAVLEDA